MPIKVVDLREMADAPEPKRTVLINGPRFHAWFHPYLQPGQRDEMHCHNADQTFYCIDGECTMHFPDGSTQVLRPGMVALITGGSFYQLENSGDGPMIMMGNRSGSSEEISTIGYESRQELFPKNGPPPKGTQILV
jgi:mannose-6-phosphate isomerase-like protein (cupin superfamily)